MKEDGYFAKMVKIGNRLFEIQVRVNLDIKEVNLNYDDNVPDITNDVWGGAGPDCCIQPQSRAFEIPAGYERSSSCHNVPVIQESRMS